MPIEGPGLDRGVVFQNYTLLPWLTALGNVEFALRAAGLTGREARGTPVPAALVGLAGFEKPFRASFPAACSSASPSPAR